MFRLNKLFVLLVVYVVFGITMSLPAVVADNNHPYTLDVFQPLLTVNVSENVTMPCWPDIYNENIVFLWKESPYNVICSMWVMNVTRNDKKIIYQNDSIDISFSGPKFSPDGEKIVFTQNWYDKDKEVGGDKIMILSRNGSWWNNNMPQVHIAHTVTQGYIDNPNFSPYNNKIIYESNEGMVGEDDVWVINIDGTNKTRLTNEKRGGAYPSFSPDGKKIIYMPFGPGGNYELWIMDSDGTDKKRLLDESWYPDEATFTPDGRILFASARVSPHSEKLAHGNIWIMDSDGNNKILLVPRESRYDVFSATPSMSNDCKTIVFEHGLYKYMGIYKVEDPTGEWKDSDGDGVWDGIDGAPFDPEEGYIKDAPTENFISWLKDNLFVVCGMIVVVLVAVLVVIFLLLRRRKK